MRVFEKYPNLCILHDRRNGSLASINLTTGAILSCSINSKIIAYRSDIDLIDDDIVHNGVTVVFENGYSHLSYNELEKSEATVGQTFFNWACKPYYSILNGKGKSLGS